MPVVLVVELVSYVVLALLAEHRLETGKRAALLVEHGLVRVPVHDVVEDGVEEAAVTVSLVLSAAGDGPRNVTEML